MAKRHASHAPRGPLPITSDVQGWTPEKQTFANQLEQKHGLPEGTLRGMSYVESNFGRAREHSNAYHGEYQLGRPIRDQYQVPEGQSRNWQESMKGGAAYAADNMRAMQSKIGRQPTRDELYLAHQQGEDAASRFINHPDTRAGSLTSARNIRSNNGNPNAPASQFIKQFTDKFETGMRRGGDELWATKSDGPRLGDQSQLALRGGDKGGAADVLTAALDRAQRTQPADNRPVWAKTQADQVAQNASRSAPSEPQARSGQYAPAAPGSVLNRINPADRSGPLLPEPGAAPQRQMADVRPNDFGRGIPASRMETPGVGQRLDPSPSIQTARQYAPPPPGSVLNRINPNDRSGPLLPEGGASRQMADVRPNDFGRGIPPSQMQTPGVGQRLDPMTERQIADAGPNDFGRGMPASRMETPGVGQRLDPMTERQFADLGPNDFGRGIPASTMETPGVGQRLDPSPSIQTARTFDAPPPGSVLNRLNPADPSGPLLPGAGAPPTQMAQVGPNDFGRGIPVNGMQTPGVGMMLEQMQPTQFAQAGPYDFAGGIPANGMQMPGLNPTLAPPVPAPPNPQMADAGGYGDSPLGQQLNKQWENRPPYIPQGMSPQGQSVQSTVPERLFSGGTPTSAPTPPTPMGDASVPGPAPSAPMPPQRPSSFGGAPIQTASVSRGAPVPQEPRLFEPQGGGGGVEGMAGPAGGGGQAQVAPEFMSQTPMGGQQGFDLFGDLGGLFADAFVPIGEQSTQFADTGSDPFAGGDFGGGFDLGSLFA